MKKKRKKKTSINSSHTKKDGKIKKPKRKWWKKILSFFIVCCALGIFAVFAFFIYIVQSCDEFDPNALANQDQTIIYDGNNNIIAKLGMEKRESITYDKLPQVLIDAIVATEDSRFFQHNGVDGARFMKASIGQVLGNRSAGGASTLTMQVVKNNLTSTDQTITRKFKDVYLAVFFMERKYTKEEILEFYVNDSLLGGNVYGVEEASKYYFGKSVSDLSLPEAAIIAGLFQSPNGDNPYKNPDRAKKRMQTVLKLMVRHGYITQEEADMTNQIDVSSLLVGTIESNSYQGFIDTVVAEVKKKTGSDPALVSMEVHTTMNPTMQDGINRVMAGEGYNWIDEKVQAGITIVDVKTGKLYFRKGESISTAWFSRKALLQVFDNILSNAKEHGFTDKSRQDYVLQTSWTTDGLNMLIKIANNGTPLPSDLNTDLMLEYGYTTALNQQGHAGIGGGEIAEIMHKFGGDVRVISTPDKKFTVTYVLSMPLASIY